MKKILPLLILICCFSTSINAFESMISTVFNADLSIENTKKSTTDVRPKFRIGFDAPQINHRQLLLTIDENCTDGVDWGYDGETPQVLADDMYWLINNKEYVIQGIDSVFSGKEIPLGVFTTNGGVITIKIDALENPITGLKVGLKDTTLNIIHKLEETDYQVTLSAGTYHDRFLIVFLSADDTELPTSEDTAVETTESVEDEESALPSPPPGFTDTEATEEDTSNSEETEEGNVNEAKDDEIEETEASNNEENNTSEKENNNTNQNYLNKNKLVIYVNNGQGTLNVKNKRGLKILRITLLSRNGQRVQVWNKNLDNETIQLQLQANRGIYLVMVQTDDDRIIKRVLIQNS